MSGWLYDSDTVHNSARSLIKKKTYGFMNSEPNIYIHTHVYIYTNTHTYYIHTYMEMTSVDMHCITLSLV